MKNQNFKKENDNIKQDNKQIREELAEAKSKIERLDKERREKNIVVSRLDINNMDLNSLKETMEKFILQHMHIQIEPKKVYKLSDKMCLTELKNLEDKATIMKNKAKLKQIKKGKVYINDDLSVIEREKQKQIRRKANKEKGNGKDVKIGYNKVIADGVKWKWDRAKEKLEKAQSKN
ncbi:hypothetical protein ILUMI_14868 [Ignelater luminosus]|uniref:Uncharacterized protein n=1 Tax=Ignelater luminosus TaxID=2038154 RepID=A0A8K0CPR7_IGNLU|nr:hypothetical protein ILUMI_14868 [Ignelater luminosus]